MEKLQNLVEKYYAKKAKRKNDDRNIDGLARQDLKTLTKHLSFNEDYKYIELQLNKDEKPNVR